MIALLEHNQEALAQLCREYGVVRLELFGSAARNENFDGDSDLDLIVTFDQHPSIDLVEQYFGFKEALEDLFGRHVDLVEPNAVRNPYFLKAIESERTLLYAT